MRMPNTRAAAARSDRTLCRRPNVRSKSKRYRYEWAVRASPRGVTIQCVILELATLPLIKKAAVAG